MGTEETNKPETVHTQLRIYRGATLGLLSICTSLISVCTFFLVNLHNVVIQDHDMNTKQEGRIERLEYLPNKVETLSDAFIELKTKCNHYDTRENRVAH